MNKKSIILRFSIVVALLVFCSGFAFATDEIAAEEPQNSLPAENIQESLPAEEPQESLPMENATPEIETQAVINPNNPIYSDNNNKWEIDNSGKYRYNCSGIYLSQDIYQIDDEYYAFDKNGHMVTNHWYWKDTYQGRKWYYAKADGRLASEEWIGDYYLNTWCDMAVSQWIIDSTAGTKYYVGADGKYIPDKWVHDSKGWKYKLGDGNFVKDKVMTIDDAKYGFKSDGYMAVKTWYKENRPDALEIWYYAKADGRLASDEWVGNYHFSSHGNMEINTWVFDLRLRTIYYVGEDGLYIPNSWKEDSKGWMYILGDGKPLCDNFFMENGKLYAFDKKGYWVSSKGWHSKIRKSTYGDIVDWYFVQSNGSLVYARWVGNYFFSELGILETSTWIWDGTASEPYYVNKNGEYTKGKWMKDSKGWWYYLGEEEFCRYGAYQIDGIKYVFDTDGYLLSNSWDGRREYYAKDDGTAAINQWVDGYFLNKKGEVCYYEFIDGYWIDEKKMRSSKRIGTWKKDSRGWWYQLSTGSEPYLRDCIVSIDQKQYYFDKNGYMITNKWHKGENHWYYAKADGSLANEEWIGDYYFNDGAGMETNEWVYHKGQFYYVDKNGKWDSSVKW